MAAKVFLFPPNVTKLALISPSCDEPVNRMLGIVLQYVIRGQEVRRMCRIILLFFS
jgi:hypothetical protein